MYTLDTTFTPWNQQAFQAEQLPAIDASGLGKVLGAGYRRNQLTSEINDLPNSKQFQQNQIQQSTADKVKQWVANNPKPVQESDESYQARLADYIKSNMDNTASATQAGQASSNLSTFMNPNFNPINANVANNGGANGLVAGDLSKQAPQPSLNDKYNSFINDWMSNNKQVDGEPDAMYQDRVHAAIKDYATKTAPQLGTAEQPAPTLANTAIEGLSQQQLANVPARAPLQSREDIDNSANATYNNNLTKATSDAQQQAQAETPLESKADYMRRLAHSIANTSPDTALKLIQDANELDLKKAQMDWSMRPTQTEYAQVFSTMRTLNGDQGAWDANRARFQKQYPGIEIPAQASPESLQHLSYQAGANEKFVGPQQGTREYAQQTIDQLARYKDNLRALYGDSSLPGSHFNFQQQQQLYKQAIDAENQYNRALTLFNNGTYKGTDYVAPEAPPQLGNTLTSNDISTRFSSGNAISTEPAIVGGVKFVNANKVGADGKDILDNSGNPIPATPDQITHLYNEKDIADKQLLNQVNEEQLKRVNASRAFPLHIAPLAQGDVANSPNVAALKTVQDIHGDRLANDDDFIKTIQSSMSNSSNEAVRSGWINALSSIVHVSGLDLGNFFKNSPLTIEQATQAYNILKQKAQADIQLSGAGVVQKRLQLQNELNANKSQMYPEDIKQAQDAINSMHVSTGGKLSHTGKMNESNDPMHLYH